MFDDREFLGAAVVGAASLPPLQPNKRQISPSERQTMGTPPSGYSTSVAILLPTDEQLGADTVAKLKPANDLNVARMLAGTAGMFDGAAGLV